MSDVMIGMDGQVVDGLPTSYGNIDDNGKVLYLDAERLARKEWAGGPIYQNRPANPMMDIVWPHLSLSPWNYGLYAALFRFAKPLLWHTAHPETATGAAFRGPA